MEGVRMKGESWILYPERGEVLVLERGVPRLNDLGLAMGKGVDSAVSFHATSHGKTSNT
jgi:hypothetical protein